MQLACICMYWYMVSTYTDIYKQHGELNRNDTTEFCNITPKFQNQHSG